MTFVDEEEEVEGAGGAELAFTLEPEAATGRLDKALAGHAALQEAAVSRERLKALMSTGALTRDGAPAADASATARPGLYVLRIPAPVAAEPEAQDLPLTILFEDADLIVVDKPAGMAAHPGPGTPDGTLVNALLHHCGHRLSGVGGVLRPGVVHRLDKDTSGVMVAAKSDRAHQGLSALFAAHDLDREYLALVRGAPSPAAGDVKTRIGRNPHDRKKMAVLRAGGREALTRYRTERTWTAGGKAAAARLRCRLETGRTHQIRVHMAHLGAPVLGDPTYGSGAPLGVVRELIVQVGLSRQALHAAVLGFRHPVTGEAMRFETPPPADMGALEQAFDTHLSKP